MNLFEKIVFGAGLVVAATTIAYRYMLDDERKQALREMSDAITNSVHDVSDSVTSIRSNGRTHAEEQAAIEASRAHTASQWEALGY